MEIDSPESQLTDGLLRGLSRSNEKKFVCNYLPDCKAAFSRQEHLQRHIRKHTGERPFSCGCGRTFTRLDNLRQHAQTVHSGTEMARISDEQNAIAAATKLRPTPNSPPPRVDGGSDSDPYPRPVTKLVKAKIKSARREIPPLPLSRSASPAPVPTPTPDPALPTTQEAQGQAQAQDLSMQPPVVTCENMLYTHHASLNSSTDHHQSSSSSTTTTTTTYHTGTPSFTTHTPYTQLSNFNPTAHYDVESSVGSQPISSLAKRRAPKHDFVYTGGHMMNSPGTMTSVSTDFDFSRATHDTTTPDEGEQMSEYINNGLEPKSTSTAATTTATTANTSTAPPSSSSNMDSHGDVPGILLHFACQNPDLT